jgi:hypothetical protein
MALPERPAEQDKQGEKDEKERRAKKPYQKPAFRHERVFETMALACGKVDPVQLQCSTNPKNS